MTERSWPSEIPVQASNVYRLTLKLLTSEFPDPSVFSYPFLDFLDRRLEVEPGRPSPHEIANTKRQLLGERGRMDPLIQLFREWAAAELAPRREPQLLAPTGRKRLYVDQPWSHRRYLLAASLKEIANLVAHGWTARESVVLATRGDEKSLLSLVELDKVFLTARFAREWLVSAQSRRDAQFFTRLARSVERDTLAEVMPSARLGIACYLLWFLGFEHLGKRRLLEFIESEDLAQYPDPKTFDRFLSRLGIKSHTK